VIGAVSRQPSKGLAVKKPSAVTEYAVTTLSSRQPDDLPSAVSQPSAVPEKKYKLTARISHSLAMELKLFCTYHRIDVWQAMEAAVREYLGRQTAAVTHDDIDDDVKSDKANFIINLYHEFTGNDWKEPDWDAYKQIKTIPLEIVETGMLVASLRAPRPIRSFAYFVSEIQNPEHGKLKSTHEYITYLRMKLAAKREGK
ncbi:MAG: hypothetical protein HY650_01575, partial [Acidobacteria bacterium]|nr:hypothetical protein [Acidobacteriota bacterium]